MSYTAPLKLYHRESSSQCSPNSSRLIVGRSGRGGGLLYSPVSGPLMTVGGGDSYFCLGRGRCLASSFKTVAVPAARPRRAAAAAPACPLCSCWFQAVEAVARARVAARRVWRVTWRERNMVEVKRMNDQRESFGDLLSTIFMMSGVKGKKKVKKWSGSSRAVVDG